MTHITFRKPTEADLGFLSENLRDADALEASLASGLPLLTVLQSSAVVSPDAALVEVDGVPAAVFGTVPVTPKVHGVWLLGTDAITEHWIPTLRVSRGLIRALFLSSGADFLFNFTHHENATHIRWLRWVGAELFDPVPYGINGELFIPFEIKRETYNV